MAKYLDKCLVCGSAAMGRSEDGVTCGDISCKDKLPYKVEELVSQLDELLDEEGPWRKDYKDLLSEHRLFQKKVNDLILIIKNKEALQLMLKLANGLSELSARLVMAVKEVAEAVEAAEKE